jgi:polysaccharide export outer membrane protein
MNKPTSKLLTVAALGLVLAGVFLTPSASSQGSVDVPGKEADRSALRPGSERFPRYELRAGDVLEISFEFTPEFNQTVPVQPDGFIILRDVGDLQVGGLTVPELTKTIRNSYQRILKDPVIAVALKDFEKPYFIASGEVVRPGKYELRGDTTVVEAIALAGGFVNQSAKHSQVVLYRRVSPGWMRGRVLNVKQMLEDNNLNEDLHVKPGDMIMVPQNRISKVERFLPIPGAGINVGTIP